MTPDVVAVKALPDYVIEAEFADGEVRRFILQPYLAHPAFADLRKDGLFMRDHIFLPGAAIKLTDTPPPWLHTPAFRR